ncbi:hypothetical protein BVI434_1660037 [Burkholderia vietnamiensis]|nr:hypothetical protein BVI434_1660037 [Burkholderia vietnamiensis]
MGDVDIIFLNSEAPSQGASFFVSDEKTEGGLTCHNNLFFNLPIVLNVVDVANSSWGRRVVTDSQLRY